jgi:hypothetical protein
MHSLARPLMLLGVILVIAGVGLLAFIGITAFQIIDNPQDVRFVKFLLEQLQAGTRMVFGHDGKDAFELHMSEPAQTVILIFLGVMIFWVVAGIARSILAAGVSMIRLMSPHVREESGPSRPDGVNIGR